MASNISLSHKPPTKRQKKRIAKYLSNNEEVIVVTSIGNRYLWINVIFFFLIPLLLFYLAVFMFFGIITIEPAWLKYLGIVALIFAIYKLRSTSHILRKRQSNVYVLTNNRILIITGIFSRKIVTAPLNRITHITVDQTFIQRLLYKTGHLLIITAGFDQREIMVEHISNPIGFKILVEDLTSKIGQTDSLLQTDEKEVKIRAISF